MNFRTDLAMEAAENGGFLPPEDVEQQEKRQGSTRITRLHIRTARGEQAVGKPCGRYITLTLPPLSDDERRLAEEAKCVGEELAALLPAAGTVLVVGLGNRSVTPDTLGPATAARVLATRHIRGEFARAAGLTDLRPTAVLTPGVLGQTGTESSEIVRGVCSEVKPSAVIVVDALAARSVQRLGCTVQLCDTGISPGSGVGNNRQPLNEEVLGVPVVGIGIPTVVDAATLVREMTGQEPAADGEAMMVTPREIDTVIGRAARLLALAINGALQPAYAPADLTAIAGEM